MLVIGGVVTQFICSELTENPKCWRHHFVTRIYQGFDQGLRSMIDCCVYAPGVVKQGGA